MPYRNAEMLYLSQRPERAALALPADGWQSRHCAGSRTGRIAAMALRLAAAALLAMALSACTTSGQVFDTQGLHKLTSGATTLAEATAAFGAQPVDVYRSNDGSLIARWAQKYTWVTDAVYWRKEVWLAFDSFGRYTHQVENINARPLPPDTEEALAPSPAVVQTVQPASPVSVRVTAAGSEPTSTGPLGRLPSQPVDGTVTSYPVQVQAN